MGGLGSLRARHDQASYTSNPGLGLGLVYDVSWSFVDST